MHNGRYSGSRLRSLELSHCRQGACITTSFHKFLDIVIKRLVAKPSSNARLLVFEEPTIQSEKVTYIYLGREFGSPTLDERRLKPQNQRRILGVDGALAATYQNCLSRLQFRGAQRRSIAFIRWLRGLLTRFGPGLRRRGKVVAQVGRIRISRRPPDLRFVAMWQQRGGGPHQHAVFAQQRLNGDIVLCNLPDRSGVVLIASVRGTTQKPLLTDTLNGQVGRRLQRRPGIFARARSAQPNALSVLTKLIQRVYELALGRKQRLSLLD